MLTGGLLCSSMYLEPVTSYMRLVEPHVAASNSLEDKAEKLLSSRSTYRDEVNIFSECIQLIFCSFFFAHKVSALN